jgi:hypothetical protein
VDDKQKVLNSVGNDLSFKTVFKATLAFYLAQGLLTLSVLAVLFVAFMAYVMTR